MEATSYFLYVSMVTQRSSLAPKNLSPTTRDGVERTSQAYKSTTRNNGIHHMQDDTVMETAVIQAKQAADCTVQVLCVWKISDFMYGSKGHDNLQVLQGCLFLKSFAEAEPYAQEAAPLVARLQRERKWRFVLFRILYVNIACLFENTIRLLYFMMPRLSHPTLVAYSVTHPFIHARTHEQLHTSMYTIIHEHIRTYMYTSPDFNLGLPLSSGGLKKRISLSRRHGIGSPGRLMTVMIRYRPTVRVQETP